MMSVSGEPFAFREAMSELTSNPLYRACGRTTFTAEESRRAKLNGRTFN